MDLLDEYFSNIVKYEDIQKLTDEEIQNIIYDNMYEEQIINQFLGK